METGFELHDTMIYASAKPPLTHRRCEQSFEYMFVFVKGKLKTFNPIMRDNKYAGESAVRKWQNSASKDGSATRPRDIVEDRKVLPQSIVDNIWDYNAPKLQGARRSLF